MVFLRSPSVIRWTDWSFTLKGLQRTRMPDRIAAKRTKISYAAGRRRRQTKKKRNAGGRKKKRKRNKHVQEPSLTSNAFANGVTIPQATRALTGLGTKYFYMRIPTGQPFRLFRGAGPARPCLESVLETILKPQRHRDASEISLCASAFLLFLILLF